MQITRGPAGLERAPPGSFAAFGRLQVSDGQRPDAAAGSQSLCGWSRDDDTFVASSRIQPQLFNVFATRRSRIRTRDRPRSICTMNTIQVRFLGLFEHSRTRRHRRHLNKSNRDGEDGRSANRSAAVFTVPGGPQARTFGDLAPRLNFCEGCAGYRSFQLSCFVGRTESHAACFSVSNLA